MTTQTANAYTAIIDLVHSQAGIRLTEAKHPLIRNRLNRRLSELGCDIEAYAERCRCDAAEREYCIDRLTTNHTAWLREPAHFIDLAERIIPEQRKNGSRRLRIWCSAASTGEEPYTIALTLLEHIKDLANWDIAILATDISHKALAKAREAIYRSEHIIPLSPQQRQLALKQLPGGRYQVRDELRRMVHLAKLNLIGDWPMNGPFDIIFCRNVMIYFDGETRQGLINRFYRNTAPGGYLFIGHSESLGRGDSPYDYVMPAVYRKAVDDE